MYCRLIFTVVVHPFDLRDDYNRSLYKENVRVQTTLSFLPFFSYRNKEGKYHYLSSVAEWNGRIGQCSHNLSSVAQWNGQYKDHKRKDCIITSHLFH
jgi:hypothetical protein